MAPHASKHGRANHKACCAPRTLDHTLVVTLSTFSFQFAPTVLLTTNIRTNMLIRTVLEPMLLGAAVKLRKLLA